MRKDEELRFEMARWIAALLILSTVAGCARVRDSSFNPFNWFGGGRSAPAAEVPEGEVNPLIPQRRASIFRQDQDENYRGTAVAVVRELRVDRTETGAVVRATGVTTGMDAYDVRLVPNEAASVGGVLVYELRAIQPPIRRTPGPEQSRTVTAGYALSFQELLGVRSIQVVSGGNTLSTRP